MKREPQRGRNNDIKTEGGIGGEGREERRAFVSDKG